MIELLIVVAVYILSILMGTYGVIYCLVNDLMFCGVLCIIFIACTCVRIDALFDTIDDVGYFNDEDKKE